MKDDGQTFLVDGQSYTIKVVRENIAKINEIRKVKGHDKFFGNVYCIVLQLCSVPALKVYKHVLQP